MEYRKDTRYNLILSDIQSDFLELYEDEFHDLD
jgi:hypothetical protein